MIEPRIIAQSARALQIVAFSDCRVQDLKAVVTWLERRLEKPDLIIYAGDDLERFVPDTNTNYFEQLASLSHYGVVAVAGNDDPPEYRALIRGHKVYEIHSQPVTIGRFLFAGVEGASILEGRRNLGFTLYSESEIAYHLRQSFPESASHTIIIVSHAPPRGCLDEAMRHNVGQIGSTAVRDIVENDPRVALVVSGHVHLCGGRHDQLGSAIVLNAASNDNPGAPAKIATFHLKSNGIVENLEWTEVASRFQLAEINGIGSVYASRLAQKGIITIEHLAGASPDTVGRALGWSPGSVEIFVARAQARLTGLPSLVSVPKLPERPRLYLDIETDLQQSYTWLVGIATEEGDEVRQFFAPHPSKEGEMLRELAAFLETEADRTMVHFSGTQFDRRILIQRIESQNLAPPLSLLQSIDCLPALQGSLALPTRGLGLRESAEYFGYGFTYPELDGFWVAYEYQQAIQAGRPIPERLLAYNRDDVLALRFLVQQVEQLAAKS